ncbi:MAG: ABC transporter permease [Blastocatellia bacterium]
MERLIQDVRYGWRLLVKSPGFTIVAVFTLALGIGANTAIFSVVNSVLFRSLPYPHAERLMTIWENHQARGGPENEFTSPTGFEDWRDQAASFDQVAAYAGWQPTLTGQNEPEQLNGAVVSHNVFTLLGVGPQLGRAFSPEEDKAGAERVVIIGYGLWQRRFGGDPSLIGRTISLMGEIYTVIGVMPAGFRFPVISNAEIWRTIRPTINDGCQRGCLTIRVLARLKPGVTQPQAAAELDAIARRVAAQYPDTNQGIGATVLPLRELVTGNIRMPLLVMLGAVGLVLLIACANVANLLLARAATREREMAVRAALGAGRWRIIRQLLSESLLLALAGGLFGLLLGYWMVDLLITFSPPGTPRVDEITLDRTATGFTLAVTLLTGVLFGLAPAWQMARADLNQSLRDSRGETASVKGRRVLNGLVIAETALALMLLVGAGLLMKSFIRLQHVDPGFRPQGVLTAVVALPRSSYPDPPQIRAFYRQLLERLGAVPGVENVGAVSSLPLGNFNTDAGFLIEGRPKPAVGQGPTAWYSAASRDYFQAIGIRLRRGRMFTERDHDTAPKTVIISESFARRYFTGEDPLGKRIGNGRPDGWREIIGVVDDVRHFGLDVDVRPTMYFSDQQQPARRMCIVLRTAGDPLSLASALRAQVLALDRNLAVSNLQTMEQITSESIAAPRFTLLLIGLFAVLALLLAAAGIYGVMSYAVTQRTHEVGIRLALGAQSGDVLKMVISQGLKLVIGGVLIGLAGALALTKLMKSLLFSVSASDPLTFATVALMLIAVALLACWIPARRATKVDPMIALRCE